MTATSTESFEAAINNYKSQHDGLTQQLAQLETNYRQQKEQMVATLHMLSGAIAAVEQIVKNVEDEAAALAADTPLVERYSTLVVPGRFFEAPETVPEIDTIP